MGNLACVASVGYAFARTLETPENTPWSKRDELAVGPSNHVRELVLEKCNHQIELVSEMRFAYFSAVYIGNTHCMEQFKFFVRNMLRAYQ